MAGCSYNKAMAKKQNKPKAEPGFIAQVIVTQIGKPKDFTPLAEGVAHGLPFAYGYDPETLNPQLVIVTKKGKAYYEVNGASLVEAAAAYTLGGVQ